MSPAFCPQCGTAQASRANFCPDCGADLSVGTPPVVRREGEAVATVAYAGFGRRLAAWVIDTVLLGIVSLIISVIIVGGDADDASRGAQVAVNTIAFAIAWGYYAGMESSTKQGTLGKMILGIVVTDVDGQRITFMRATGRHFAKIISGLLLFIGYLMVIWTARKQGLHDIMAGTLVVQGKR